MASKCGYRIMAVRQFSKLSAGVRFPLPAQILVTKFERGSLIP